MLQLPKELANVLCFATMAFFQQLMTGTIINRKATSFLAFHWIYKYILIHLLVTVAPPLLIGRTPYN